MPQALQADARRPKKERRTGRALFEQLQAAGYWGCYSRVTDFIRHWRHDAGKAGAVNAYVPLSFGLGEAFQFDWSEESLVIGGIHRRLQVAHLKLCASRAFWLVAYPVRATKCCSKPTPAPSRRWAAFPGAASTTTCAPLLTRCKRARAASSTPALPSCVRTRLEIRTCSNVASGWEKGVVEKNVQDSRRRIWTEASTRRFGNLAEPNAWLGERGRQLWQQVPHPEHSAFSVAELLEHERAHLMPMPAAFDGYVEEAVRVSSTCLISVARNRDSVPCELAGQMMSVRLYPTRVKVVAGDTIVAEHERLSDKGRTAYDWLHYIPLVCSASTVLCETARRSWNCPNRCSG